MTCYNCEQFGPVAYCWTCERPMCAPEMRGSNRFAVGLNGEEAIVCGRCSL